MEGVNAQMVQLYTNLNKVHFVFHVIFRVVVSVNSPMFVKLVWKTITSPLRLIYASTVQLLIVFLVSLTIIAFLAKAI